MQRVLTLHEPRAARAFYLEGLWRQESMFDLLRDHAQARPGDYALRDGVHRLTWAELLQWVEAVAAELHGRGLVPGDRVSTWLPSRIEAVIVLLACSRNGYICNPSLHQNYTAGEVLELLARIGCRAVFFQSGWGADAPGKDLAALLRTVPSLLHVCDVDPGACGTAARFPARDARSDRASPVDTNPDKIVYLAFTSGTTGKPKAVMHSDNTLLANGRAMVADWGHDASTVMLSLSPISHHIATVAIVQSLVAGAELVLNDPRARQSSLQRIEASGCDYVLGVPTHAIDVLAELDATAGKSLARVRTFYLAGSTIPPETARKFHDLGITPQNVYGMTENGSHQYTLPSSCAGPWMATCGKSCRGYEVRLWHPERPDEEAAHGEIGEIGGRGALLMLGYFDNQEATERSFNRLGWFMSGDLGRFDDDGNLQIVGRKKDVIIRGGHNIYPSRIEELALRQADILEAAAFPVPDPRLGERVCLAVRMRAGAPVPDGALLRHLQDAGLSKYDLPEFVLALESFPRTASGKVLKRELTRLAADGTLVARPLRFSPSTPHP